MGYYVSNMIGIRSGGVFDNEDSPESYANLKRIISETILQMRREDEASGDWTQPDMGGATGDPSHCMSQVLHAHKGSYVVLAGVFNYWHHEQAAEFAKRISKALSAHVMHMSWDEENNSVNCQVWNSGEEEKTYIPERHFGILFLP